MSKKLKLDILEVESFVLGDVKNVSGGTGGNGGGSGSDDILGGYSEDPCPTFDTTGRCCIQNDNS